MFLNTCYHYNPFTMTDQLCIHIAYADDHELVRTTILSYIQNLGNICTDIEADNGLDLIKQLEAAADLPDVIMLDINMPVMDGYEALQKIREKWPHQKVLVLTALENDWHLIRMISMGINGYASKSCSPLIIKQALMSIHEYDYYYANTEEERFYTKIRSGEIKLPHITDKEREYLKFCPTELSYAQIAGKMNTTVKAIEGYMARLCEKLNVKGRLGLAMFSVQFGFAKMNLQELGKSAIKSKR